MTDANIIAQSCVMQSLRTTARRLTQRYEGALKPENLTASQFSVLVAISAQSGVMVTTLAKRVGLDRTTLNRVLTPLERRNLVKLSAASKDARAKAVALTEEGHATLARAIPLWKQAQDQTIDKIGPDNWTALQAGLKTLRAD